MVSEGLAADSLRYALDRELVKLYGAIVLGYVIIGQVQFWSTFVVEVEPYQTLVELPFLLCGTALVVVGVVGAVHRILSDTVASESR